MWARDALCFFRQVQCRIMGIGGILVLGIRVLGIRKQKKYGVPVSIANQVSLMSPWTPACIQSFILFSVVEIDSRVTTSFELVNFIRRQWQGVCFLTRGCGGTSDGGGEYDGRHQLERDGHACEPRRCQSAQTRATGWPRGMKRLCRP